MKSSTCDSFSHKSTRTMQSKLPAGFQGLRDGLGLVENYQLGQSETMRLFL